MKRILTIALSLACLSAGAEEIHLVRPEVKRIEAVRPGPEIGGGSFRLRIVSFNDLHGNFREKNISIGTAKFVTALDDVKNNFDRDLPTAVCVLCGGDNFSGTSLSYYSMFDRETGGEKPGGTLNAFFARCEVVSSCIGNHAFDWVRSEPQANSARYGNIFLEDHLSKSTVRIGDREFKTYTASNIVNKETGRPPGGVPSYDLISVEPFGFRLAIVSLTTLETLNNTLAGTTEGYVIEKPAVAARRIMERVGGDADAFLFLAHLASYQDGNGTISFGRDAEDMRELVALKPLAIVSAHSHRHVCGLVDGVPVVQAGCYANGIARLDFLVDTRTKKTTILDRETVDLRPKRDSLRPDAEMSRIVAEAEALCRFTKVGTVREDMPGDRRRFTDIGTLICKALSTAFRNTTGNEPVFAFQHSGGIRSNFSKGEITEEDCFDMLPFESGIDLCRISGQNVLRLLRAGFTNPVGYLQCYGWTFYYDKPDAPKDRFIKATFRFQGREFEIDPDTNYWIVLDDFIVQGGDNYPKDVFEGGTIARFGTHSREILVRYCRDDLKGDIRVEDADRPKFVVEEY